MSTSKELQFQKVLQIHLKPVRKNVLRIQTYAFTFDQKQRKELEK